MLTNGCLAWILHRIWDGFREAPSDDLLVNYGLKYCERLRKSADRDAALRRTLPWRVATYRRVPAEFRRVMFEVLCCFGGCGLGEGVDEAATPVPIEDVEGVMKALSVVRFGMRGGQRV